MGFSAAVITVSDRGHRGQRVDESGPALRQLLLDAGAVSVASEMVPDERETIARALRRFCRQERVDLVITTGGTGLSARDVTPEATLEVIDREAPGLAEAVRAASLKSTPHAMLSRAVSGIAGSTLILNFPGSPRACAEAFAVVRPALAHAIETLAGGGDCAR